MAHSVFGASAAHRWIPCPGSIAMSADIPSEPSGPHALEGSAAHCAAADILVGKEVKPGMFYFASSDVLVQSNDMRLADTFSPIVEITADMLDHVQTYVDYCNSFKGYHFTEVRVSYERFVPNGFGTSDHIVISGDTLHVIDLKFGKGVKVFAERNEQALLYALGAVLNYEFAYDGIKKVVVHIHQPRLDHVSTAKYSIEEVFAFGEVAGIAANLATGHNPPLMPGKKQCQWCPAKAVCPGPAEAALRTACEEFGTFDDALNTLAVDPDMLPVKSLRQLDETDVALMLAKVDEIESWCSAIRGQAHKIIHNGGDVPGYKLVEGRSNRQWVTEAMAIDTLKSLGYPEKDIYTRSLVSPAQAEKLVGKKQAAELESAIFRPEGKPSLATADDPRPALNFKDGSEFN